MDKDGGNGLETLAKSAKDAKEIFFGGEFFLGGMRFSEDFQANLIGVPAGFKPAKKQRTQRF